MRTQKRWQTLAKEYAIDSPFFRVRKEVVRLPTGEVCNEYFIHETRGWVAIFCMTEEGKVVLNWQYKHGIGKHVLELPAGGIDAGETPLVAAKRELWEETGYVASRFECIRSFIVDPTASDGIMYLFYCEGAHRKAPKKNDPKEQVANRHVSVGQLVRLLKGGRIRVMGHVAAIYCILDEKGLYLRK